MADLSELSPMMALMTETRMRQLIAEGVSSASAESQALEEILALGQKLQVTFEDIVDSRPPRQRKLTPSANSQQGGKQP